MEHPEQLSFEPGYFEQLIEEYADRVFNVALRITGNRADAEDAMQEAFVSAFKAWPSFRGEANPKTWLYRIAVNSALMRVRSRQEVTYLDAVSEAEEVQDWSAGLGELAERGEIQEQIMAGIRRLEPDQRAALVLRDVDGLSTAEAAAALEISEQALKSRLHRARILLREYLAEYFRQR